MLGGTPSPPRALLSPSFMSDIKTPSRLPRVSPVGPDRNLVRNWRLVRRGTKSLDCDWCRWRGGHGPGGALAVRFTVAEFSWPLCGLGENEVHEAHGVCGV